MIVCDTNYSQIVHASGGEASWHVNFTCSEEVSGHASLRLWANGGYVASTSDTQVGVNGSYNIRTGCQVGLWYGQIAVTYSAPGYTSASSEGQGPDNWITSC